MTTLNLDQLLDRINQELLPNISIESVDPNDPIVVHRVPVPWEHLASGNYTAVFVNPNYPHYVVKVYAPGRDGWEEEVEVYRRIGEHPAYSQCFHAQPNFLVLKRLHGVTLYDCISRGLRIPPQVIQDIDQALDYARDRGLTPHDVHGRNVMMKDGRGLVVDISDFLHEEPCRAWDDLKRAYRWIYIPFFSWTGLRIPLGMMDWVRASYRQLRPLLHPFRKKS
ncbi:serine/threonine-protein kinase [Prochlorothrix hollandica]|uniref:Serine/threonine protein kinase n=1 Tax=Prochlorothrix hollandica PCC 9006 = CALU 1027 TaxID=317619 RepID=A0A0M2PY25_PROHO|nr:hypothetical protein [Prochlorothrix hollandica]KKJ01316.1 serine/threonine protein kinase [Prochlorothrix hollandica PCC 9006 = CALU 1027]